MVLMLVTFCVSKWLTSILVRLLQLKNMLLMLVTSLVFKFSMPVIVVRFVIPANQLAVVVGRA